MARDPVTVKNPGCLVLLGWLQALEKHTAISSEGNFHETALWGHPALAPPHFFPRKAASSPNRTPENVDLRNVNKNKQEKEAFGNLGKAGKGAAQWKAPQDLKKSSLLFVHCTGVNAMKLSLGARYLAGTVFLLARMGGFMWTSSPDRRNFPFESKLGDWPWWWKYFLKKQGIVHSQFLGWWMQGRGIVSFSRHHKKTLQTTGLLDVTHVAVNAQLDVQLTSEQNSLQEKQHGLKYCAFK